MPILRIAQASRRLLRRAHRSLHQAMHWCKKWCWRLIAAWLWIHFLALHLLHRDVFRRIEILVLKQTYAKLVELGFSPPNLLSIKTPLLILGLLIICGFSNWQLLGLGTYIAFSPLFLLFRVVLSKHLKKLQEKQPQAKKIPESYRKLPILWFCSTLLVVMYTLYGNSTDLHPIVFAIGITTVIFLIRLLHSLSFATIARPQTQFIEERLIIQLEQILHNRRASITSQTGTKQFSIEIRFYKWVLRWLRFYSSFLRGPVARRRVSYIALFRYVFNLSLLGALIILIWALVIKAASSPLAIPLGACLEASGARIIPGIPPPLSPSVSDVIQIFAASSAFVTLVLYAGPIASIFPELQRYYIDAVIRRYQASRTIRSGIAQYITALESYAIAPKKTTDVKPG